MRRALYILAVLLALVVALVLLAPILLKDRVVDLLLTQVNSRVDADVALESADVSLFADFPDLHLDARGLVVTGRAPFEGVELARVGHLGASVDLMSLYDGPARVTALTLEDTTLDIRVNADGKANTDLTAPAESAPSEGGSSTELWVRNVAISNLTVRYADATANTDVVIDKLNVTGDAEVADALVALRAKLDVPSVSVKDHGVELLRSVKIASDLDVRFAPETGALRLGDSTLRLNELSLGFAGTVEPQAGGTALDLTFSADKTSFKGLLSLIPGAYTPDFGGVQADGALSVKGAVKGLLPDAGDSLPGLDLAIGITDGRFQYPSLPAAVSDAQLDLVVHHPGGPPDALELDVKRFRLAVDGSPLEGRLSLRTPVTDPTLDTEVRGKLDLARLAAAFPDTLRGWTGLLTVDLQLAGKASAFSKGDVDAVRAGGTLGLQNATLTDPTWPMPVTIEELTLAVDPRKLDLTAFRLRFGESDLTASGGVENAIGWALADDTLVGRLDVKSTKLDLDPWAGGDSDDSESSSGESRLVAVPKNLDLACSVDLAQVLYDGWDLRKVTGEARVKDGAIQLDDLRAETLGGAVSISGTYAAPTDAAADVDIRVTATDLLASDTIARMETLRKLLPGVSELKGRLRTGFGVQARLGPDLSPDLTTLASVGKLGGKGLSFAVPFLEPVARELGDSRMGNLALDDGDVGFQVQKGALKIDRMPITLGPAKGVLHGKTGVLDESLDLALDLSLPTKALTGALKATLPGGAPENVDVTAKVGGTWRKPQVKVALGKALAEQVEGQVREAVGAVVDAALAQAEAKGEALVAEAEKQADRMRAEAKKQADALRKKADDQAKKLVKDAKGNPLQEAAAKEAAKAARAEADKAATKLEKEADKKGDELVSAAEKQKDKLIAAAKTAR